MPAGLTVVHLPSEISSMLKKHPSFAGVEGPVLVVVLDGIGLSPNPVGNAVHQAYTPYLDRLLRQYPNTILKAHGKAVGMPSDQDMGNSEVGHNAMGGGMVYNQGAALVNEAIDSGRLFEAEAWREIAQNVRQHQSTLHFIGLFSDGNVHSHLDHLKALILRAKQEQLGRVRVHILLDGRDVPETSALEYVEPFEAFLAELRDEHFDIRIASGGGRMKVTMDRYEANWSVVETGWKAHVLGDARQFDSATQAIQTLRAETKAIDQDLPAFVIVEGGEAVGTIHDGDSVVYYNFRGDRALEITRAFEAEQFDRFDRVRHPRVCYAGMLEYDGDLKVPKRYLVPPPSIKNTLGENLARSGVTQLAISETQKYGHVTYFWNGNRSGKFDDQLETYIEIPSDIVPFEQRPWMKAADITDTLIEQLRSGKYRHARVNYANGDMVGHTGIYVAALTAVQTLDICLSRLLPVVDEVGGMAIVTADHGNADEMFELDKKTKQPIPVGDGFKAKTAHTLNPVPCIFYDNHTADAYEIAQGQSFGLSNLAATIAALLGYQPSEGWDPGILRFK
jgi:2,3-bisphosphoglycerate-independent phosphoglycerate mutase